MRKSPRRKRNRYVMRFFKRGIREEKGRGVTACEGTDDSGSEMT